MAFLFEKIRRGFFPAVMIGAALSAGLFALPSLTLAQEQDVPTDMGAQLYAAGGSRGAGLGEPVDPRVTAMLLIRSVLKFIGLIIFCLIIYAGFLWMTAAGNDEQTERANKIIRNSIIGLIIVLSSYSLTSLAVNIAIGRPTNGFLNLFI